MGRIREKGAAFLFRLAACASILAVVLICVFLFGGGVPALGEIGPLNLLLGQEWKPGNSLYGILPMILGSLWLTPGTTVPGTPLRVLSAVFLALFFTHRPHLIHHPMVSPLPRHPSPVYAFFGPVLLRDVGLQL